jgi:APA family basic amino acid/polyamine antiporter
MTNANTSPRRLLARKSVEQVRNEAATQPFRRVLGPVDLVTLGIGCIIGAGIFVLTGNAAANFAGPAVLLSFLVAGLACAFTGLCYAELASTLPVSGSAYTYSYTTLGEVFAWITGWLMVLELGVAVALVAVGFSGYVVSLLRDFGVVVPAALSTAYINSIVTPDGLRFVSGQGFNLVAVIGVLIVSVLLIIGISTSAAVNRVVVITKVLVLIAFAVIGSQYVDAANWTPFMPENEGGFAYGWPGVLRQESTARSAHRHSRLAGCLHPALRGGGRRAHGRRAVPAAGCRRSHGSGGRCHEAAVVCAARESGCDRRVVLGHVVGDLWAKPCVFRHGPRRVAACIVRARSC